MFVHNKGSPGYISYREMKCRIDFKKISRKMNHSQTNHSGNKLMTEQMIKYKLRKTVHPHQPSENANLQNFTEMPCPWNH